MNRRAFVQQTAAVAGGLLFPRTNPRTRHLIFIVNGGGVRKKDYYENAALASNVRRLAADACVFEESHCEQIASHAAAFEQLVRGRETTAGHATPTILDYIGGGCEVYSIASIPQVMRRLRPRIVVCKSTAHDVGHDSYEHYLQRVKSTDAAIGRVFDWVRADPVFCDNTAIVLRPEFGRDDEVNVYGSLHHSYGFYYTHRVASIFWGPDFNRGVDQKTVVRAVDIAPTLTKIFGIDATYAQGRVAPGLFRTDSAS